MKIIFLLFLVVVFFAALMVRSGEKIQETASDVATMREGLIYEMLGAAVLTAGFFAVLGILFYFVAGGVA